MTDIPRCKQCGRRHGSEGYCPYHVLPKYSSVISLIIPCKECGWYACHPDTCSSWSAWMHYRKADKKALRKLEERAKAFGVMLE